MPRKNPFEPWLHQASGYWCKKIEGRVRYLDRDYATAKQLLRKLIREQSAGKQVSDWVQRPIAQLCDEFLEDIKARKAEATFIAYRHRLLRGLRIIGAGINAGAINKSHLSQIERSLTSTHSSTTVRDTLATLQAVFSWACRNDMLEDNPIRDYVKPRARERTRIVTLAEFQALLRNTDIHFQRVLLALRLTGCRPKEVRTLIWEWVDLETGFWVLPDHKTITQQRRPKPRIIPLAKPIWGICRYLAAASPEPAEHVFVNVDGKPYSKDCFCRKFARLRKRAGIKIKSGEQLVLYSNRHTFGTRTTGKVSDIELAELMGHTDTRTTRRYVHLDMERLREIQERSQK